MKETRLHVTAGALRDRAGCGTAQQPIMSVPPLPKIDGDAHIILDVYTHSSLRSHLGANEYSNDEYGDADRLALLGREVLDLAITHYWYRKLPQISADQLVVIIPRSSPMLEFVNNVLIRSNGLSRYRKNDSRNVLTGTT